jgi:hypothetical protein
MRKPSLMAVIAIALAILGAVTITGVSAVPSFAQCDTCGGTGH